MTLIPPAIFQLYRLLPKQYKRKLLFASIGVFLVACADLISLGVLLPVLVLVLNDDNISQNTYFSEFYQRGGFESEQAFIGAICLGVFLISLARTLFNTYMQYSQNKRLFSISKYLSLRLYQLYYSNGFLYIKQQNSHRLISQINAIAQYLIMGYFIPFTSLICEVLVIFTILAGLVWFSPYVFLLVFCAFVPISLIYYKFSRARIKKYGEKLYKIQPEKNKILQQTFIGYADMEMNNSFSACKKKYSKLLDEQGTYSVRNSVLNTSLQRVLELAVICSMIVLIMATQMFTLPPLGVIIGLFVIAVYRILPGVIKGTSYYFMMRSNSFAFKILDELEQAKNEKEIITQQTIVFGKSIRFDSVNFSYDKTIPVIKNLSLEIKKGDFVGIKGESGSGKSTLFHLLLGFISPDMGSIYVDNTPLTAEYMDSWHSKIGYVSQQLFMIEGTLWENIVMGDAAPNRERVMEALRLASLNKFVDTLPQGVDTFIGEGGGMLSGGQRQRLGIARALYKKAELLLFDEATSSLDEQTEQAISQAILHLSQQRHDLTLLIISHRPESLAICRRVETLRQI